MSALVTKLLEKDPAKRPPNADAVLALLAPPVPLKSLHQSEKKEPHDAPVRAKAKTKAKASSAATRTALPRRKVPVAAWVALVLLLLAGGAAAVFQFVFATKDGNPVVEVDEDADVRFKNGKLEIYDETGKKLYTLEPSEKNKTLPPGKYLVKVVGADSVKLGTDNFEMGRKGKALVKVKAAGPQVAVKDPPKVDPLPPVGPDSPSGLGLAVTSIGCHTEAPNYGLDRTKPWTASVCHPTERRRGQGRDRFHRE